MIQVWKSTLLMIDICANTLSLISSFMKFIGAFLDCNVCLDFFRLLHISRGKLSIHTLKYDMQSSAWGNFWA